MNNVIIMIILYLSNVVFELRGKMLFLFEIYFIILNVMIVEDLVKIFLKFKGNIV